MPVSNKEITSILVEVADLLDLSGESPFRIRSYRNAARAINGMSEGIAKMAQNKSDIQNLPGIGKSIAEKIEEIARTGKLLQLEELRRKIPVTLIDIMKLDQMGPQRTKILYDELSIKTIDDLEKAALEGKIENLKGFGKKSSDHIIREIKEFANKGGSTRIKLNEATELTAPLLKYLSEKIKDITVAGSLRRGKETVGDIDIIGYSSNPSAAMDYFVKYEDVQRIISKGETRASVKLRSGMQVDLRIVEKKSLGAALLYFTGSKAHTIAIRRLAQEMDLKINEYGIYKEEKLIASNTERDMYGLLGLPYIEPELREDKGEIEAATKGELPELIKLEDIRGDLHSHTNETDGKFSLHEMVNAAQSKGYEYFAISDHSKRVAMAHGLDPERLAKQIMQIDDLNKNLKNFKIIKAVEVDILEDGTLDLPDSILKELDMVICAVHYNRNLSRQKQTRRILKAMENPFCNIIAHPTGRMIGKRNEFDVDMQVILREAKEKGIFPELNCNPARLDLSDIHLRQAKEMGLKVAVSTDAHSITNLENMKYGIFQARRGWLTRADVINTRSWAELKMLLKRS